MTDVQTTASVFSSAITFKTQKKVLANLRADLVYADPAYAEQGEFDEGTDTLLFTNVPDLAFSTTPLTEGSRPDKRALSISASGNGSDTNSANSCWVVVRARKSTASARSCSR